MTYRVHARPRCPQAPPTRGVVAPRDELRRRARAPLVESRDDHPPPRRALTGASLQPTTQPSAARLPIMRAMAGPPRRAPSRSPEVAIAIDRRPPSRLPECAHREPARRVRVENPQAPERPNVWGSAPAVADALGSRDRAPADNRAGLQRRRDGAPDSGNRNRFAVHRQSAQSTRPLCRPDLGKKARPPRAEKHARRKDVARGTDGVELPPGIDVDSLWAGNSGAAAKTAANAAERQRGLMSGSFGSQRFRTRDEPVIGPSRGVRREASW